MIAIATVALNAHVPVAEQHKRDLMAFERVELSGEGASWVAAKAAVTIPEGAVIMSWRQGD